MKIRLHGTGAECAAVVARLREVLDVRSVSIPYPDRGDSVLCRVYVDAVLPDPVALLERAGQQIQAAQAAWNNVFGAQQEGGAR